MKALVLYRNGQEHAALDPEDVAEGIVRATRQSWLSPFDQWLLVFINAVGKSDIVLELEPNV